MDIVDQCVYDAHVHDISDWWYYDVFVNESNVFEPPPDLDDMAFQPGTWKPPEPRDIKKHRPDYAQLRPLFGWLDTLTVQKTFESSTQYGRLPVGTTLKRMYKSANPALNVHRRSEPVATDIVYSSTPAVDNGATSAAIFVGCDTMVCDVYSMKRDKEFINALEDNIRARGAMNKLVSDRAQVEISNAVKEILRTLIIASWQSEPHQQQQNPFERRYQTIKRAVNRLLARTGAPDDTWLLATEYVCFLLNHTYNRSIGGIPLQHLLGHTIDISALLRFHFYQKVYYATSEPHPAPNEGMGYVVGISENVGPAMTYKILTSDTRTPWTC